MAERVRVREISNEEGNRLLRTVRRSSGSVVTWRRAQMVLLSGQGMDVAMIAQVTFTSPDRVRDVIHNFNADGFDSLRPKYAGGRPPKFAAEQRDQITQIALGRPGDHGLPFSTWSLSKLADYLVAQGWSRTSLSRGCGCCCVSRASPFQAVKTFKTSTDPDYEAKKNRVLALHAIADGKTAPAEGDPTVVICMDEFGPLNLQPHPGRHWAPVAAGKGTQSAPRRRRATYTRPHGVRHLLAGYDLFTDRLYGHVVARKGRTEFLAFCRYLRSLHPMQVRIAIVLDNFSPHLSTATDHGSGTGRRPTTSSWPTSRSTAPGSTGSRPSSPHCATSPSTAPTTPATPHRPS
jgi:transposase